MKKPPTSISVISWIFIVFGGINLISTTTMTNNPLAQEMMSRIPIPIAVQFAQVYIGIAISIISGILMLKGYNWARYLYVIWSLIGFVIQIATSPVKVMLIPGFLIFLLVTFFLFRPNANAFFAPTEEPDNA